MPAYATINPDTLALASRLEPEVRKGETTNKKANALFAANETGAFFRRPAKERSGAQREKTSLQEGSIKARFTNRPPPVGVRGVNT